MKNSAAPAPPVAAPGKKQKRPRVPLLPSNSALPAQNRRVLAQHYRAKYGVK